MQVNAASASLHPSPHFLRRLPKPDFELKMPNSEGNSLPSVLAMSSY